MRTTRPWCNGLAAGWALLLAFKLAGEPAAAKTMHMQTSSPVADAIIHGDHSEYVVRFDGPIDHAGSRLEITQNGKLVRTLTPSLASAPDVLYGQAMTLSPGHYQLHWQAKSTPDGEVSSGEIPFTVAE
jgi:methionine-rich copper-binding protein CopC